MSSLITRAALFAAIGCIGCTHPWKLSTTKVAKYVCQQITKKNEDWNKSEAATGEIYLASPSCSGVVLIQSHSDPNKYFGQIAYAVPSAAWPVPNTWVIVYATPHPSEKTVDIVWSTSAQIPKEMQ